MRCSPNTPCWLSAVLVVLLIAMGSLGLPSWQADPPQSTSLPAHARVGVFRLNLGMEPPNLDPAKVDDLTSFSVLTPMLKGLTELDGQMQPRPALAKSWDVSPDGLRYVFHLRPEARWSDGQPVTSADFVYAWHRVLQPQTGAPYAFLLFEIRGAQAYYDGAQRDFSKVGVRAPDAHTLVVELARPIPFFLDLAAHPVLMPVRADRVAAHGERFTEAGNWVSNGAYHLARWAHEERITLVPNPYFYGPPATVSAIEMVMVNDANTSVVMYENDELDFIETTTSIPSFDVRRLRQHPDARHAPIHRLNYFGFNTQKAPFDDPRVRQAFAHALDRSYYPRLMQSGQIPWSSWISPGLEGENAALGLQFDPEKAKALLAEAGYPNGRNFPTVTLAYPSQYDLQKEAEIAQYLWKTHLNVPVRLENQEWKVYLSRLEQDPPHLFRLGWFVDYADADSFMGVFVGNSGNNHTGWRNARYDQWVHQARVARDVHRRQALYDQAQRLLLERDTVIVPIYAAEKTWLLKPWVRGFDINALNLPSYDRLCVRGDGCGGSPDTRRN